jgi:hypothetical protein
MASNLVVYYSIYGLFATWLQMEFKLPPAAVATPILLGNLAFSWATRRSSMIVQAMIGCIVAST